MFLKSLPAAVEQVHIRTVLCFGDQLPAVSILDLIFTVVLHSGIEISLPCGIFLVYAALKLGASSLQFFDQKSTGVRFQQIAMGLAVQIFLLFCHAAASTGPGTS